MEQSDLADFWQRAARRTARRLNAAWWWQSFAPLLVGGGAVGFALLFWLRSREIPLHAGWVTAAVAGALLGLGIVAWAWGRRKFIPEDQALVALEARLKLHNALSVAAAGRAPWPPVVAAPDAGFRWSWSWIGGPFSAAAACLAAALLLPVPGEAEARLLPPSEPPSWQEMASWLETLQEEKIVEDEQLAELRQKLEELRAQPEKDWYRHESLEATDSLRESLERSLEQMGAQLDSAARSLNGLENYADQLSAEAKDKLAADFQAALEGLRANELKLDPELMKKLSQVDPKNLAALSPEQLQQLREALKKNAQACKECQNPGAGPGFLGDGQGSDDEEMAALMKLMGYGQGEGGMPGTGGVSRGPGAAPLFLGDTESRLGTNNQENVRNDDLSRAAPADLIGLGEQEHQLDKTERGPREAGAADTGRGGEQVWQDSLAPGERAVLKRYFNRE